MRYHKTDNVLYECIYDDETAEEFTDLYSMLPNIQKLALEKRQLEQQLAKQSEIIEKLEAELKDYRDEEDSIAMQFGDFENEYKGKE